MATASRDATRIPGNVIPPDLSTRRMAARPPSACSGNPAAPFVLVGTDYFRTSMVVNRKQHKLLPDSNVLVGAFVASGPCSDFLYFQMSISAC